MNDDNDIPYLSPVLKAILYRTIVEARNSGNLNLQLLYELFTSIKAQEISREFDDFVKWLYNS